MPIRIPAGPKTYTIEFPRLDGGLNLWAADYDTKTNQSPELINMIWKDGALGCRDGQAYIYETALGTGYACYGMFGGKAYFHIGNKLYSSTLSLPVTLTEVLNLATLYGESYVPSRGVFFEYDGNLYYKANGVYVVLTGTSPGVVPAYTPVTVINAVPSTGAGDLYQPENRYSPAKTVWYTGTGSVSTIQLPVADIDSVDEIFIDGVELETGFTPDLVNGAIAFASAITSTTVNGITITYSKENATAYASIMTCKYAEVFGGDTNVCVVLGGCTAQQNAYFWTGNHAVMDVGYFPIEHYNLAGDSTDGITGFGKQQNLLVVFKNRSIGKAEFGLEQVDGRELIRMYYTTINAYIGCDLPYTVQLIDNRLVFCNSTRGIHIILDSSSAYENNIAMISRNINGTESKQGLIYDISQSIVCSIDNGKHYILVANGHAYVWDYVLSNYNEASWFYYTNIAAIDFIADGDTLYHMAANNKITKFQSIYSDYGSAINKVCRFATQNFSTYDRLKDITDVTLVTRAGTNSLLYVEYMSDYDMAFITDPTPINVMRWSLVPRNLAYRYIGVQSFATAAHRKPRLKRIRHFAMRIVNNVANSDMVIVAAQIAYRFSGKER